MVIKPSGDFIITATSALVRVAADGTTSTVISGLNGLEGVVIAPNGDFIVSEISNGTLRRVAPDGSTTSVFFSGLSGPDHIAIVSTAPVEAMIDIKPGSATNSINVRSGNRNGLVHVAILSEADFDASSVDPATVEFGPNGAGVAHAGGHIDDINRDGFNDLLLHFATSDTGIACGDTSASLTGTTFGGQAIEGTDSVTAVPCR